MDRPNDLAIYVHWPFCEAICPYCDFNVRLARNVDHNLWRRSFADGIRAWSSTLSDRRVVSVFFGGGTPSLMEAKTVAHILDCIASVWPIAPDAEISLEANPTSVEINRFRDFTAAGVNRLSIGLQALDDAALRRLGRRHTAEEGRRALAVARDLCDQTSFDLIYGRPDQDLAHWEAELRGALAIGGGHCSLYQLTIEPGTPFGHQMERGRLKGLPDDARSADFYELTTAICRELGYERYEISNFARLGAQSRHNRIYWQAGDWIGLGPGSHGRITLDNNRRVGTAAIRDPNAWIESAGLDPLDSSGTETLSREAAAEEVLFSGLRLREGFPLSSLERWGFRLPQDRVQHLTVDGLLRLDDGVVRATDAGCLLVDAIVADLVPLQPL